MESNAFIRRIDNLGRIVIPKEIRKKLKFKNGESLSIVSNQDEIILKKHSYIQIIPETMILLFEVLHKMYKINIIITDLSKIIYSKKNDQVDKALSDSYIRNIYEFGKEKPKDKLLLTKNIEVENYWFKPLNVNGDIIGSLLILYNNDEPNKDLFYTDIIYNLLITYLDI